MSILAVTDDIWSSQLSWKSKKGAFVRGYMTSDSMSQSMCVWAGLEEMDETKMAL